MAASNTRTAIITGASSGLGAEFARQLASMGYNLILTARREERLQQLAAFVHEKFVVQAQVYPADLSKIAAIDQLVSILNGISDLEMLVNCAGFGTLGRFYRVDVEKEIAMMNGHMVAPVMFCRAALPGMVQRDHGAIINVASLSGFIHIRNTLYQSSKAFLVSFSESLSAELRDTRVQIQALCPGFVLTEFLDTPEYAHYSRDNFPQFLWQKPAQVVSESLRSLQRGDTICIPGRIYKVANLFSQNRLTAGLISYLATSVIRRRRH